MKKQGFGKRAIALGMSSVLVCTTPVFAQDVTGQNTVDTGVKVMQATTVAADVVEESPLSDFEINDGVLEDYLGSASQVVIPSGVTKIANGAFKYNENLTTVVIPEGVTIIDTNAFEHCENLTSVTFPKSLETIGMSAFEWCSQLSEVVISDGIKTIIGSAFANCESLQVVSLPKTLETIGSSAFSDCVQLKNVTLQGVKTIGTYAFWDCESLTELSLPEGLTEIGYCAFYNCKQLKTILLPEGLTSIEKGAFGKCTSLTKLQIPKTVQTIPEEMCEGCSALEEVSIPEGVIEIQEEAFSNCESLQSVTIPEGMTQLHSSIFRNCRGLQNVSLPKSLKIIGDENELWGPFDGCTGLEKILIPSGVTTIHKNAFEDCDNLRKISIPESVTEINGKILSFSFFNTNHRSKVTIYGKAGSAAETYAKENDIPFSTDPMDSSKITFDSQGGTEVETQVVEDGKTVTEPTAPTREGYTFAGWYLGETAYDFATPVEKDITLTAKWTKSQEEEPEEVVNKDFEVDDGVLVKYNGSDASVEIPEGITRIEKDAFKNNKIVEKISIPTGVTSIGESAFYNCSNLRKICIPETVESIASNTFSGKKELLIYGVEGSYAESYASEKKIAFSTKTFPENENQILECAKTSYKVAQGDSSFKLNVEQTYGNGKVTYQSSDKNVVSVSSTGVVSLKGPGVAQITVKAAKTINYEEETLKVKVTVNPKESHITSKNVKARKWTLKWIKDSKVTGYQIQYSTDKKFKKGVKKVTLKKNSTTTWTSPKLTVGKTYYARVRSYKTVKVNGKSQNLYSTWCDTVSTGKVKKK
ncbi:MAG: leucine-rich repeat protein [Lachnospiraceae bacterium]